MANAKILITGNSSGLGLGFTRVFLAEGWQIYGLSRRGCPIQHSDLHDLHCDLAHPEQIAGCMEQLLNDVGVLDLVILNAGILGEIKELIA